MLGSAVVGLEAMQTRGAPEEVGLTCDVQARSREGVARCLTASKCLRVHGEQSIVVRVALEGQANQRNKITDVRHVREPE